jgi:outer membrane protein
MEARIQKFQQTAQDDMARKEQELVAPLLDKAKQAVDEVAKLKGYDYVLDSSAGALVTYPEEHDLLKAVQSHLGITASE